jgi:hypothetical protein
LLFTSSVKTTFLVGVMAVVATNLIACVPGLGCAADDPEVNANVAPLTFEPTTTSTTCDANGGVTLDLSDAQGSSIRLTVLPSVRLGESLPLTADAPVSENVATSSTSDGRVRVTLTDAEYNELPSGWQNAAVEIASVPAKADESLTGSLYFYFADGRTLSVTLDSALTSACGAPQLH